MIAVVVLSVALAAQAPEEPHAEVTAIVERAEAHYQAGEYAEAAAAFGEAFEQGRDPKYLYAQAQAERLAGDCPGALEHYDQYLATDPPTRAAEEARANRARCDVAPKEVTPEPEPQVEPEPTPTPAPADRPRPWYRDPWGGALVGSGAVVAGIGAGVLGFAISSDRNAPGASNEQAFLDAKNQAQARQRAGIAVLSIGGAMLVAGAIRWAVVGTRPRRRATAFGVAPGKSGATFVVGGRF